MPFLSLPVVDLSIFFHQTSQPRRFQEECETVADALHEFGLLLVKDPRIASSHAQSLFDSDAVLPVSLSGLANGNGKDDNARFLDMMEKYFQEEEEVGGGQRDARPQYSYQLGITPEQRERPRNHCKIMAAYGPDDKPLSPCPPEFDAKWRFLWRIGPMPPKTEFPLLNAHDEVVPPGVIVPVDCPGVI